MRKNIGTYLRLSTKYQYSPLLKLVKKICRPTFLIGCSSAGEFISNNLAEGAISALAIKSTDMQFNVGIGKNLHKDVSKAAKEVVSTFKGKDTLDYQYKSALVLVDALAGYTDSLLTFQSAIF